MHDTHACAQDTEVDYSNVLTLGGVDIAIGDSTGAKKALPPGTKRNAFRGYEVVDVPALDPGRLLPPAELVQISALEDWAQAAFKGYKALNRIQSRIFEVRCASRGEATGSPCEARAVRAHPRPHLVRHCSRTCVGIVRSVWCVAAGMSGTGGADRGRCDRVDRPILYRQLAVPWSHRVIGCGVRTC